jgi:hypothetical protein
MQACFSGNTSRFGQSQLALVLLLMLFSSLGLARDDIREVPVKFKKGTSSAVVNGSIRGYQVIDYVLNARRGQSMNVSLATRHGATYFNILAPGETDAAMFIGSTTGRQFEGRLPKSGDYRIRVYMMRSAARRNEQAQFRLEMNVSGGSQAGLVNHTGDALVPGTDFHATGTISCTLQKDQPARSCRFGVRRQGRGSGNVTVTKPNGQQRVIFFQRGQAAGYDMSQADRGEFKARKRGDLNIVRIGNERYEIPDAVIFGG